MKNKGCAFIKGGAGCFAAFATLALLVLIFGGSVEIDLAGAIFLFLIGGVIGLVVNWIYQKGRRDARGE